MRLLMRLIQNLIFIDLIFLYLVYIILEKYYICVYFNSIISNILNCYVNKYVKNILKMLRKI